MKKKLSFIHKASDPKLPDLSNDQLVGSIYQLSKSICESPSPNESMDEIALFAKQKLKLDLFMVYARRNDGILEPAFARSNQIIPSYETDLSWGETVAKKAVAVGEIVSRAETSVEEGKDKQKPDHRQSLSLPLSEKGKMIGALVLIRNHGPEFLSSEVEFANFLANLTAIQLTCIQTNKKLSEMEKLHRLTTMQDDFIALISHELLTPLGFIKGYATTLLRDDINWEQKEQKEFLTIIDDEADRLKQLIDDLLDSSGLQQGTLHMVFQPVNLDSLLKDIALRAGTRNEEMSLEVKIIDPGMRIIGDSTRLAQVFDNLFSNAAKYAQNSPIMIELKQETQNAELKFIDHGPGIPSEFYEGVFQRFFRVPGTLTSVRGSGLGLFICKQIIQAHNGKIFIQPTQGSGTTIVISLPLVPLVENKT